MLFQDHELDQNVENKEDSKLVIWLKLEKVVWVQFEVHRNHHQGHLMRNRKLHIWHFFEASATIYNYLRDPYRTDENCEVKVV